MISRLLVLSTIWTLCTAYLAQREYCNSNIVVKAKLLPPGSIKKSEEAAPPPVLPPYHRRFEIEIEEVFKSQLAPLFAAFLKGAKYHAISKDTGYNHDADGCDFYQRDPYNQSILSAVLYFDSFDRIFLKRTCKGWEETSDFEKHALRESKYNCECEIGMCLNRVSGKLGEPDCPRDELTSIACDRDDRGRCIWRGAKRTCVNPVLKKALLRSKSRSMRKLR